MTESDFERFRPICVCLTKGRDLKNIIELSRLVQTCEKGSLQGLQEYVLFPLRLQLKTIKGSSEEFCIKVIQAIREVFDRTAIERVELFQDLFTCLCVSLSTAGDTKAVKDVCEEYKEATVECLQSMLKALSDSLVPQVYSDAGVPALGHLVTLLLNMAEQERSRSLRCCCITCIDSCVQIKSRSLKEEDIARMRDVMACFLPGITMALTRIITTDAAKQGHVVISAALQAWHNVVCFVMDDDKLPQPSDNALHKELKKSPLLSQQSTKPVAKFLVNRSQDWVKITSEKVEVLCDRIKAVVTSSENWRVRLNAVHWASQLLKYCSKSLSSCVSRWIEVLVSLAADEYTNVSTASKEALKSISSMDLEPVLQQNLHSLITQLPRRIRALSEGEKLVAVREFHSYLELLSSHLHSILYSSAQLLHLSQCLVQVLEFDCSAIDIIQEETKVSDENNVKLKYDLPQKQFLHFRSNNVFVELRLSCQLLGCHGDFALLVDHFLDLFNQSTQYRKQTVFILNELCRGVSKGLNTSDEVRLSHIQSLCSGLLDVYLSPDYLNLPCEPTDNHVVPYKNPQDTHWMIVKRNAPLSANLREVHSNILTVCLMLEGIASVARVFGENFKLKLLDVMYPVLEKAGSDNATICQTALWCLHEIAHVCKYSNIAEMLSANADYLVSSISLRMRKLSRYPRAPAVLRVILSHSQADILPLMEDTILETLAALDAHYEKDGLPFMTVLLAVVQFCAKCFGEVTATQKESSRCVDKLTVADVSKTLREYFLNKQRSRNISEEFANEANPSLNGEECSIDDEAEINDTEEKEHPYYVIKLQQILERCVHIVGSPDVKLRLLTLETIACGMACLKSHQDVALPLVHKLWPALVPRFADSDMRVILKSCDILLVLADVSRDFIRQRVTKDVFPKFEAFLKKQSIISLNAGTVYHHSLGCKLQASMLRGIGKLCRYVNMGDTQLHKLMWACVPHLNSQQPIQLQQVCLSAFYEFAQLEPDTVWLLCHEIGVNSSQYENPPHPSFRSVRFTQKEKCADLQGNLATILQHLETT